MRYHVYGADGGEGETDLWLLDAESAVRAFREAERKSPNTAVLVRYKIDAVYIPETGEWKK